MVPLVSKVIPMVDVDLFTRDDRFHMLLMWREGGSGPPWWYIPASVAREELPDRIAVVAGPELRAPVTFMNKSLLTLEVIQQPCKVCGQAIALLFDCQLLGAPSLERKYNQKAAASVEGPCPGNYAWYSNRSDNLIPDHEMGLGCIDGAGH